MTPEQAIEHINGVGCEDCKAALAIVIAHTRNQALDKAITCAKKYIDININHHTESYDKGASHTAEYIRDDIMLLKVQP